MEVKVQVQGERFIRTEVKVEGQGSRSMLKVKKEGIQCSRSMFKVKNEGGNAQGQKGRSLGSRHKRTEVKVQGQF